MRIFFDNSGRVIFWTGSDRPQPALGMNSILHEGDIPPDACVENGALVSRVSPELAQQRLEGWRRRASTDRQSFCRALRQLGILNTQEAIAAAKGDWPDPFKPALAALPGNIDPDDAMILWAGVQTIERMNPVFLTLQAYVGMSDELADSLFGGPPENVVPTTPELL